MCRAVGMHDRVAVLPRLLRCVPDVIRNTPNRSRAVNHIVNVLWNRPAARVIRLKIRPQNALKFGEQPCDIRRFQTALSPNERGIIRQACVLKRSDDSLTHRRVVLGNDQKPLHMPEAH